MSRWSLSIIEILVALSAAGCKTTSPEYAVKVVGGTSASNDNPGITSAVGLLSDDPPTTTDSEGVVHFKGPYCTGVLIRDNVVLTAGHCIPLDGSITPKYVYFEHPIPPDLGIRKVTQAVRHPDYQQFGNLIRDISGNVTAAMPSNDVALLLLDSSAPSTYRPVTSIAPESDLVPNSNLALDGYGLTNVANSATVLALQTIYGTVASYINNTSLSALLVVNTSLGQSMCEGDSGGPAYIHRSSGWALAATSTGGTPQCNGVSYYTASAPFSGWIASTIAGLVEGP